MQSKNIVIVGGGIGGLVAAKTLAKSGFSPLLLERNREFGLKACGEMVIEKMYGFSVYDFLDDESIIERKFDRIIINFYGKEYVLKADNSLKILKKSPSRWLMVSRKKLEEYLAEEARKAGAIIQMGKEVVSLRRKGGSVLINNEIETKLVIGADGFHSKVRGFTGQKIKKFAFAMSAEAETDFQYPHLFVSPNIISRGYAWIFPQKETANVGIGGLDFQKVKPGWEKFCKNFKLEPRNAKGAFIPAQLPIRTYFDNILLVGDAAALSDPLTGGGINNAMVSGYLAAEVAKEAISRDRYNGRFLGNYEKEWKGLMFMKLYKCYILQKLFYNYFSNHRKITSAILKWLF